MPNIAQQDYIIIDWEGKNSSDAAKKAEVDAQLKNIYLANPLALFSVLIKNYGEIPAIGSVCGWFYDDGVLYVYFPDPGDGGTVTSFNVVIE